MLGTTAAVMGGSEIYEGLRGVNPVKDLANKVGISDDDYYLAFTMATVGAGAGSSALSPFKTNNNATVQKEEGPRNPNSSNGGKVEGGTGSKLQEVFDTADNYTLSDDTFNYHILDRHGPNSTYGNKSHFNAGFNIKDGIDSALKGDDFIVGPNTAGREGYIFQQNFANPIGTNSKGQLLYTLKVVIDEAGNVITAFPKK